MEATTRFARKAAGSMVNATEDQLPQLDPATITLILTAAVEVLRLCTAKVKERIARIRNPSVADRMRLWGQIREARHDLGLPRGERVGAIAQAMFDTAATMTDDEIEAVCSEVDYLAA